MAQPLVVGFDLDLTLVDTRPGIAATYRALAARTGVFIDAEAAVTRLGPPLDVEMGLWFPPAEVAAAGDLFRELYPAYAIDTSPAAAGAADAIQLVRDHGGRVVVITGKFAANARLHLEHLGLAADEIVGWAWAEGKVAAMLEHGVGIYVGDHPADMSAARAASELLADGASIAAIGVTTGLHGADELLAAGADAVLVDLTEFPRWLDNRRRSVEISVGLGSGRSLAL